MKGKYGSSISIVHIFIFIRIPFSLFPKRDDREERANDSFKWIFMQKQKDVLWEP